MSVQAVKKTYEFVVIGGGMSGICAAIAAARGGVKTLLVNNRPVLGGNASSEIRMHICGAHTHGDSPNARETGILEEILLENKYRNPHNGYPVWDAILWEKVKFQENLDLLLNTHMTDVIMDKGCVSAVMANQLTTEVVYHIEGTYFCDATGDGTLANLAGASSMTGRESRDTFGESHAPETADHICMGNTLLFKSVDMGKPIPYIKPEWANTYTESDLVHRNHGAYGHNYWWIELGGDDLDTITDGELIRDDLLKATYGVWDHIKNGGDHGADHYALDWMGFLPGKRESRRIIGDYVLNENDLMETKSFDDAIAFGGWPMDMHIPGGLKTKLEPTDFIKVPDIYEIPYRCVYSKDVPNLFIGGRIISASHMAFGSTRVMATCAVIGQAIGTAVRFLDHGRKMPADLLEDMTPLQQALLRDDAFIPNVQSTDPANNAHQMTVTASSSTENTKPENVINGWQRNTNTSMNLWQSKGENQPWLSLKSAQPISVTGIDIIFDTDLSKDVRMSMFPSERIDRNKVFPPSLVKDYTLTFMSGTDIIKTIQTNNNHYRLNTHELGSPLTCDQIKFTCNTTHGEPDCKIFEVKVYGL